MMTSAQLGPLRRMICLTGHMQAIPGSLPDLSHFGHEAMTVQSTYPGGDTRRGHAQSSNFHFNASSPVGAWQWPPRKNNIIQENVKMQAVIRQQSQAAHEAQQEGPPCVKPGLFRKLPEDDVGRDALSELAELTEESHLDSRHVLELWAYRQRASGSPDLTSI